MHYRYPPLFLILFAPLARLPLALGSAIWLLLKCGVLALLVSAIWRRLGSAHSHSAWIIPLLLAGPYVIEDFRYGNAQFFVVALTAAALLDAESKPKRAATALALAISTKVWPLFIVPYLVVRRKAVAAAWSLLFTGCLTLLPSVFIGFNRNAALLHEWAQQEASIQLGDSEIWFPNQSLRGVMMRYFTYVDYTRVPDHNYPLVNFANFNPYVVAVVWRLAVAITYIAFLAICRRSGDDQDWKYDALAFCLLPLLEPFTPKYALVVLLWPAIALGRLVGATRFHRWGYAPALLVLGQPLMPGSVSQRLIQVLGMDFLATVLLLIILGLALRQKPIKMYVRPVTFDGSDSAMI
jgi:hypothetical protein